MTRCCNCKNNRRQLISLHCKHDICIRCAADNYFLNCKNKLNGKSSSRVLSLSPRTTISAKPVWSKLPWTSKPLNNSKSISWIISLSKKNTSKLLAIQAKSQGQAAPARTSVEIAAGTSASIGSRLL